MRRVFRLLHREETGAAYSVVELAGVLALMIFPTVMVLSQLPLWIDANSTADLAAQEAARAVVIADTYSAGLAHGSTVAEQLGANHGLSPDELSVGFSLTGGGEGGGFARGSTVTATVTVSVPGILVPGVGYVGGPFTVTRASSERVDDYRSFP